MTKKYLMVDDYMLDKVLYKIKEIVGIEKIDENTVLIDKYDKLPDHITLKIVMILVTCVIKDEDEFYPHIFVQKALCVR